MVLLFAWAEECVQTTSAGSIQWRYDIPIPGFIRTYVNPCETASASLLSPCSRSQLLYRSINDTVFIGENIYVMQCSEYCPNRRHPTVSRWSLWFLIQGDHPQLAFNATPGHPLALHC